MTLSLHQGSKGAGRREEAEQELLCDNTCVRPERLKDDRYSAS